MQFSAVVDRFIVKAKLNSIFTNNLKKKVFWKMFIIADLVTLNKESLKTYSKSALFVQTFFNQKLNEPRHEISNNVVCVTSKGPDKPAHTRSLIRAFARHLSIL